jgi:hypothetical protein
MRRRFRRRWMGPKYGPARGVAVYGSASPATMGAVGDVVLHSERLFRWSLQHGIRLNGDVASLELLDRQLDDWHADQAHYESVNLPVEVGTYLGQVIVVHVEGSRWILWPNGHPVVRLPSGRELDVTAMANERISHAGPSLPDVFANATSR